MDMVIMEKQLHASMVMVPQFLVPCQLLLSLLLNARSAMPKQRLILGDIMVWDTEVIMDMDMVTHIGIGDIMLWDTEVIMDM